MTIKKDQLLSVMRRRVMRIENINNRFFFDLNFLTGKNKKNKDYCALFHRIIVSLWRVSF